MKRLLLVLAALLLVGAALTALATRSGRSPGPASTNELVVLCAAGVREPLEQAAREFTQATGTAVRFQFGGSGQLLGTLAAGAPADLFVAGDDSFITLAREQGRVSESIPLAQQTPVIAVPAGNPHAVRTLADLAGLRFGLPNPEAASLGRTLQKGLGADWAPLMAGAAVTKPTVTDLVTDLQVGSIDAALLWDGNVARMPGFIAVQPPQLAALAVSVTVGVTTASAHPATALRLARWLASPEHGAAAWSAAGYRPLPGDAWAERPVLTLYSGSVNRLPMEGLLTRFAEREGVEITTVYNGCGILCADMKQLASTRGGKIPDAYYACDICFVPPVADLYPEAVIVTETDIVLVVPKGNPKGIRRLADLARPGLSLGICNAEQSTLGYMTKRLLAGSPDEAAIMANVRSEVPTGDLLINQLRTGTLDAAIVYEVNAKPQQEHLEWCALDRAGAKAIQPFAVAAKSPHAQLARRLLQRILASRDEFTAKGFRWRGDTPPIASRSIDPDPASRDRP